ncbi:hypothetical protein ABT369_13390 [Dactylosporangium sp. NPDC000244]|uniref:hypothetical protein n=1 Tax=Dactylosporangium sp. NPDC000244 TaxID=3154365 RepID=UPI003324AF39
MSSPRDELCAAAPVSSHATAAAPPRRGGDAHCTGRRSDRRADIHGGLGRPWAWKRAGGQAVASRVGTLPAWPCLRYSEAAAPADAGAAYIVSMIVFDMEDEEAEPRPPRWRRVLSLSGGFVSLLVMTMLLLAALALVAWALLWLGVLYYDMRG